MKKSSKFRRICASLIIFFAVLFEIVSSIIFYTFDSHEKSSYIETLYYTTQIISSFFVISGVVIAVWQYYLTSKSTKTEIEIRQVQRSIDLSEYYKDNILNYYPALVYIFNRTRIKDIFESVRKEDMKHFDDNELHSIFTPQQISELKQIEVSDTYFELAKKATAIYNLKNNEHLINDISIQNDSAAMVAYISNLTDTLMNNLEFFALHFTHQTADESVVYQSLHQTYLQIVQYLYYNIAKRNTDPAHKYYTNVIRLYEIWREKENQQMQKYVTNTNSIPSTGTVVGS